MIWEKVLVMKFITIDLAISSLFVVLAILLQAGCSSGILKNARRLCRFSVFDNRAL